MFYTELDARLTGNSTYEFLFSVRGSFEGEPEYAVFAEWQISNLGFASAFERNRRPLFELRLRHIEGFAFDWLLRHADEKGRYLLLGLYSDEEGRKLSHGHLEIQRLNQTHSPSRYTARDVYGVRFFHAEGSSRIDNWTHLNANTSGPVSCYAASTWVSAIYSKIYYLV